MCESLNVFELFERDPYAPANRGIECIKGSEHEIEKEPS
jgi:hypothetical protein